jgi:hypothetical protein
MEIKNYEDDESFGSAARTAAEIKAGFYAIISCEELGQSVFFKIGQNELSEAKLKTRSKALRKNISLSEDTLRAFCFALLCHF